MRIAQDSNAWILAMRSDKIPGLNRTAIIDHINTLDFGTNARNNIENMIAHFVTRNYHCYFFLVTHVLSGKGLPLTMADYSRSINP